MKKVWDIICSDLFCWTVFLVLTHLFAFLFGLLIGSMRTQWRLESYIIKHPVYSFEETTKALKVAAEKIGDKYEEADRRLSCAAETIDQRYTELDRLSRNLEERMRREAPTVIGR